MKDSLEVLYVDAEDSLSDTDIDIEGDFTVIDADGMEEALNILDRRDVDCVVSEYELSDGEGLDLLEEVRRRYGGLPYVLFTGEGNEEVASEAISGDVTEYVRKTGPNSVELLVERVRDAIKKYRSGALGGEEYYRRLVENSPNAIFVYTEEGIRYVNDSGVELLGAESHDELLGKDICSYVVSDNGGEVDDMVREVLDEESVVGREEIPIETLEGETRYVELVGVPTQHGGGSAAQLVLTDVTDRKRAEQDLKESESIAEMREQLAGELIEDLREAEERYRTLVEQNLVGIFIVQDEEFRYVNPKVEEMTGYSRDELMSMNPIELVDEEHQDEVEERVVSLISGESDDQYISYEVRRKDGGSIYIDAYLSVTEIDGRPATIGTVLDVTDRKERQQDLERYETIMDVMGDGVYTIDPGARFTEVNNMLEELTGYSREELIGEHVSLVMDEDDIRGGEEVIRGLLDDEEKEVGVLEMDLYTKNGDVLRCENRIALLPYDDEFRGTVGVIRDITDRLEREWELERQNERLEEFVSVVSHDLRNPLSVAQGYMDLVRDDPESEYFDEIEDALRRMSDLIEDLLTLARQGRTVGDTEEVDFEEVVDRAWSNITQGNSELVKETDFGMVDADGDRLAQMLENLFKNAIEHGGSEGVRIWVGSSNGVLYVEDNGPGIPESEREEIFEHGFTTAEEGTGFGLSIVKRIVEAHDWDISVGEGRSGGAKFEIIY